MIICHYFPSYKKKLIISKFDNQLSPITNLKRSPVPILIHFDYFLQWEFLIFALLCRCTFCCQLMFKFEISMPFSFLRILLKKIKDYLFLPCVLIVCTASPKVWSITLSSHRLCFSSPDFLLRIHKLNPSFLSNGTCN